jgi:white-opaque regulator 2
MHDLVAIGGPIHVNPDEPLSHTTMMEIKELYTQVYAPGLEQFFEASWYNSPAATAALNSDRMVCQTMAALLQSVAKAEAHDAASMTHGANLEFRIVCDLASLVKVGQEPRLDFLDTPTAQDDVYEARQRLSVVEALLSGSHLDHNALAHPPQEAQEMDYHRVRELRFWFFLAEFLRIRDQPGLDLMMQRDNMLSSVREMLDGRENRDVLYSIAVIRALAPKYPPNFEDHLPAHLDESDPKCRLAVARKFLHDEARVDGGTTNVVRRFCELALRAFIAPGNNIVRV